MSDKYGLTAATSGRIVSAPDVEIPTSLPVETETTRCTVCGRVQFHGPWQFIDPWENHFDYCEDQRIVAQNLLLDGATITLSYYPGVSGRIDENGQIAEEPEPGSYVAMAHDNTGTLLAQGDGNDIPDALSRLKQPITIREDAPFSEPPF